MSVATQLGLDDPDSELLKLAGTRWATWFGDNQVLPIAFSRGPLRQWLQSSPPAATDRLLGPLAQLANCAGADDVAAAAVLCWALLPGATTLAIGLQPYSSDIDQLVASQLWIEVRSGRPVVRKVAANILMNTRRGVLQQLGMGRPAGSKWDRATPIDPTSRLLLDLPDPHRPDASAAELSELLGLACREGVITAEDCLLLIRLAQVSDGADDRGTRPRCSGRAGLTAEAVTTVVCPEFGISGRTARRRVQRSITALAEAYAVEKVPA